ncbi:MAG: hypothetical protein ACYDAC_01880 [Candidatus Dormibacteria bacterium]
MADDQQRSSGPQSEPRRVEGAPEWWNALGRRDLPLDGKHRSEARGRDATPRVALPRLEAMRRRWRPIAFNVGVLVAAILVICVGIGAISPSMVVTVSLLFGVPLLLSAAAVALVARQQR